MSELDSDVRRNAASCFSSDEEVETNSTTAWSASTPLQDARLRRLLALMEADPLGNSQDWALALNLSNSHLQHLFKEATGVALGQAVAEKRLQKAARLLTTTELRVKDIAYAVGYEHASSFTRAFERRFAQAPRPFRRKNTA